ncbi:chaperone NapD [Providencia burhodogranariea]|uniref:Chaperone NapD n=1 Tax=Providencia burhodogranariea DSM 19968 TaxID=1141662 RepID=K8X5Z5_9GAMM|nr:chaperone NapD [Providencia burhodogranariea]EKT65087.1 assembly protein for periplasmic nitrate reductase [Providencia burhodogranariea DSM 19968]
MHNSWQVCSLIVQIKKEQTPAVITELNQLPGCEVAISSPETGKLIVVIESEHSGTLIETMNSVRNVDGVLAVSLVYHQQDEQCEENNETQSS